jgi:uncharacterized membrane protein YccC
MSKSALTALRKATRGLVFMSEKDAGFRVAPLPFEQAPTAEMVASSLSLPDAAVETVSFAKFFGELTKREKWHAEDDKAAVKRYENFHAVLREQLTGLKVFKIGRVRVKIAIVGKSASGQWIAVTTDSLET